MARSWFGRLGNVLEVTGERLPRAREGARSENKQGEQGWPSKAPSPRRWRTRDRRRW